MTMTVATRHTYKICRQAARSISRLCQQRHIPLLARGKARGRVHYTRFQPSVHRPRHDTRHGRGVFFLPERECGVSSPKLHGHVCGGEF